MDQKAVLQNIEELLGEKYQDEGFLDCFTIELNLRPNNQLEVFIDSDTGITFDKCQRISRHLEAALDENGWLGEAYVLEVSSPGASRPLKLPRQYPKHRGRHLEISLRNGEKLNGLLLETTETGVVLEIETVELEGKKKKKIKTNRDLPFEEIDKAVVVIKI